MAVCRYHADRPGIGVCMRCRAVICSSCCTKLDGVNHCHACLKALGRRTTPSSTGRELGIVAAVGLLGLACLVLLGIFWLIQGAYAP